MQFVGVFIVCVHIKFHIYN